MFCNVSEQWRRTKGDALMPQFKDAIIAKTHRMTADITGVAGKQAIIINLDGKYSDSLHEWFGAWYHKIGNSGPIEGQEKIGSTPDEALDWWVRAEVSQVGEEKCPAPAAPPNRPALPARRVWICRSASRGDSTPGFFTRLPPRACAGCALPCTPRQEMSITSPPPHISPTI